MLEGLEISVLPLNLIKNSDKDLFRIEAEYFNKKHLALQEKLRLYQNVNSKANQITCGPFGSNLLDTLYKDKGILVVRPFNLKNYRVEDENLVFIDEKSLNENGLKIFKKGTLFFSRVGDIKVGILDKEQATISPNIIAVELKDIIFAKFLNIFFQCKYGLSQIERQLKISAQPTISTKVIGDLKVPDFKSGLTSKISYLLDSSIEFENESITKYSKANEILFEQLGINKTNWQTKGITTNNKSFKESFADSGRLDAEYYQPKYDIIQNHLKQFEQIRLKDLVSMPITSGSTPKAGDSQYYTDASDGIPFIRAVDIGNNRVSLDDLNYIRRNVHEGVLKKTQLKQNDVLFSIAGTVGRCGIFDHDVEANINQACAILRFNEDLISRLYLILFFNSEVGQQIIEKYARQGVQTNLNMDEIGNLQIPILKITTQQQIVLLIQQSFQLRKQSKHLLEIAKRAVEMAIETDETTAMAFIKAKAE